MMPSFIEKMLETQLDEMDVSVSSVCCFAGSDSGGQPGSAVLAQLCFVCLKDNTENWGTAEVTGRTGTVLCFIFSSVYNIL